MAGPSKDPSSKQWFGGGKGRPAGWKGDWPPKTDAAKDAARAFKGTGAAKGAKKRGQPTPYAAGSAAARAAMFQSKAWEKLAHQLVALGRKYPMAAKPYKARKSPAKKK